MTEKEKRIQKLIIRLRKQKEHEQSLLGNWEVDQYYERKLKRYDND